MMTVVSVGDRVADGAYRLHSRFPRAVNFTRRGQLVSVVDEGVGPGPGHIVVRGLEPAGAGALAKVGTSIRIGYGLHDAGRARVFRSRLRLARAAPQAFARNLHVLERMLAGAPRHSLAFLLAPGRRSAPASKLDRAFARSVRSAVGPMFEGRPRPRRILPGVRRLRGLGFGLTPGGDDFIAGMLIGLNVMEQLTRRSHRPLIRKILRGALGGNALSNAFLRDAAAGRAPERTHRLVESLLKGPAPRIRAAGRDVMKTGATSGADFSAGLVMLLRSSLKR